MLVNYAPLMTSNAKASTSQINYLLERLFLTVQFAACVSERLQNVLRFVLLHNNTGLYLPTYLPIYICM